MPSGLIALLDDISVIAKVAAASLDDYIASLGIVIEAGINRTEHVKRISQLTNKTNQFNVTTRRYTEAEVRAMMVAEHVASGGPEGRMTEAFITRLDQIRARGYEMMPSAQTAGVVNLSVPIVGADGEV